MSSLIALIVLGLNINVPTEFNFDDKEGIMVVDGAFYNNSPATLGFTHLTSFRVQCVIQAQRCIMTTAILSKDLKSQDLSLVSGVKIFKIAEVGHKGYFIVATDNTTDPCMDMTISVSFVKKTLKYVVSPKENRPDYCPNVEEFIFNPAENQTVFQVP